MVARDGIEPPTTRLFSGRGLYPLRFAQLHAPPRETVTCGHNGIPIAVSRRRSGKGKRCRSKCCLSTFGLKLSGDASCCASTLGLECAQSRYQIGFFLWCKSDVEAIVVELHQVYQTGSRAIVKIGR